MKLYRSRSEARTQESYWPRHLMPLPKSTNLSHALLSMKHTTCFEPKCPFQGSKAIATAKNSHSWTIVFLAPGFKRLRCSSSRLNPKWAMQSPLDKDSTETCRLLFIYNFIASIGEYEQSVTHATSYESRFADRRLSYHDRATWRSSCTFGLDARYAWCVTLLRMVLDNLPKSCPEVNCMRPRNFNASAVESSPDRRISLMVDGMSVFLLTLCYLSKL